jgi:hypothetical protein
MNTEPSAAGRRTERRRGFSLASVAVLVVALGATLAVMYYWPQIDGMRTLRPWAKGSLRKHLDTLVAGLREGDAEAVRGCLDPKEIRLVESDGKLTSVQVKAFDPRPGPVLPREDYIPTSPVSEAEYVFEPAASPPRVIVTLPAPKEKKLVLVVHPRTGGGWVISNMLLPEKTAQRGREYAL